MTKLVLVRLHGPSRTLHALSGRGLDGASFEEYRLRLGLDELFANGTCPKSGSAGKCNEHSTYLGLSNGITCANRRDNGKTTIILEMVAIRLEAFYL